MNRQLLLVIALLLLSILSIRLLYKYFPLPDPLKQFSGDVKKLHNTYQRWDLVGGVLALALGFCGGYVGWLLCHKLCAWRAAGFNGDHVLVPQSGICLLGALPAAFVAGIGGPWLIMQKALRDRFEEFKTYGCLRMGFNVPRLLLFMLIFFSALTLIGILLPYNTYMVFSESGLRYNTLFSLSEHRYRFSDIRALQETIKVKSPFKSDISLKLHFNDGSTWDSENATELSDKQAQALLDYISERTGLPVDTKMITKK